MLQLLGQGLLLDLELCRVRHMLQATAATQISMSTGRLQPLRTGLQDLIDARFDQLAARLEHPRQNFLARQAAIDKYRPALPAAYTPAIMAETLQLQLDALPDRCRRINGFARPPTESFHGLGSCTPVDR